MTHGRRLLDPDAFDGGEARRLVTKTFGASTAAEAREALRALRRRAQSG